MKKRILVEISTLSDSTLSKSGVTNYVQGLLGALLKLDTKNEYTLAGFVGEKEYYTSTNPPFVAKNSIYHVIRLFSRQTYIRLLKLEVRLPFDKLVGGVYDLAVFTNFAAWPIFSRKTKSITFIHDLGFEKYPEHVDAGNGRYLRRFVKKTAKSKSHIVTISESSKKDLMEIHNVDTARITVVPPAIDHTYFKKSSESQIAKAKQTYNITGKYLLFVGNVEPRKNLSRVLEAYSKLDEKTRTNFSLVLAGSAGWNDEDIQAKLAELDAVGASVVKTGFIKTADLPHIYSGASMFVFPSIYEGFGIPVLEAMACGVPVVTSNTSSLPEAAGNAAVLVNPFKVDEIIAGISSILSDNKLRDALIAEGYHQSKVYSWEESAARFLKLIEEDL